MKLKINNNILENQNVIILLSVLAATAGSYLSLPSSGFCATLPFAMIFSAIISVFISKYIFLPCSFFAVTYIFAVFGGAPSALSSVFGGYALRVSIKAAVLSLLGCAAVAVIKNKSHLFKKRWTTVVFAVLMCIGSFVLSAYECGTPWGYYTAKNNIYELVESRFDMDGAEMSVIYGTPGFSNYAVDVEIVGKNDVAAIVYANGNLSETVTELYSSTITEEAATRLTKALRENLPYDSFDVTCDYIGMHREKLSLKDEKSVNSYLSYTVNIYSEATAKDFEAISEKYFKVIADANFPCNSVTLNGGVRRKMLYSVTGNPYVPGPYLWEMHGTLIP